MIKERTKTLQVYNPFKSDYEMLICVFETHTNEKEIIDGCSLIRIISDEGDNILEWLNEEKFEYLEERFMEAYDG